MKARGQLERIEAFQRDMSSERASVVAWLWAVQHLANGVQCLQQFASSRKRTAMPRALALARQVFHHHHHHP